jgi:hypothetical protein
MTSYKIQFELPVDNPVKNVRVRVSKTCKTFFVPINHPDIDLMTYADLVAAARLSGLLDLSTPLNNTVQGKILTNSKETENIKKR